MPLTALRKCPTSSELFAAGTPVHLPTFQFWLHIFFFRSVASSMTWCFCNVCSLFMHVPIAFCNAHCCMLMCDTCMYVVHIAQMHTTWQIAVSPAECTLEHIWVPFVHSASYSAATPVSGHTVVRVFCIVVPVLGVDILSPDMSQLLLGTQFPVIEDAID